MWPSQLERYSESYVWVTPTYSTGKQAKKWNVVLLVPQGLSTFCRSRVCEDIYTDFAISLALDVKVRLWAILNSKRGCGVCVRACFMHVWRRKFFFYLKYDSSLKQKTPSWHPVFSQWSIIAELTHYMSRAYYWQFAILLSQSPDNICSSQEAPDHPLTYPIAKQQMSWCLWKLKPEMVEAE